MFKSYETKKENTQTGKEEIHTASRADLRGTDLSSKAKQTIKKVVLFVC